MNWIKFNLIFILLFSLSSCEKEHKSLIEDETMVNILIDIHFAEAAVQHLTGIVKDTTIRKYYRQIMEIHEVEQADFDSVYHTLGKDPEWMKSIYQRVQDSIQLRNLNLTR
jgi:uncharacterized protein (DUF305 family)